METPGFVVRRATEDDFDGWFALFESVAVEGRWIGRELPVDRDESRRWFVDDVVGADDPSAFVAESDGQQVGQLVVRLHSGGLGDIGMLVAADWRGRGVGSALLAAGVDWARAHGLHKLVLQLWPHNQAAQRLYLKFGFVEEGRLRRHYRRRSGELWDAVVMGLVLDETSPGSPF